MIFLTTTAIEVDEELLNRCVVLTVDEGAAQTTAIHAKQRSSQTLEGLLARHDRDQVVRRHQNAQRLLDPLLVANPWANELRFVSHSTRTRRDHRRRAVVVRARHRQSGVDEHAREVGQGVVTTLVSGARVSDRSAVGIDGGDGGGHRVESLAQQGTGIRFEQALEVLAQPDSFAAHGQEHVGRAETLRTKRGAQPA